MYEQNPIERDVLSTTIRHSTFFLSLKKSQFDKLLKTLMQNRRPYLSYECFGLSNVIRDR